MASGGTKNATAKRHVISRKKSTQNIKDASPKIKKTFSKPDMQPLVDLPEEQFGSSGNEQPNSRRSEDDAKTEGNLNLMFDNHEIEGSNGLGSINQDSNMQSMEIKPSAKRQLLSPKTRNETKKVQKQKPMASKKPEATILGKRKTPPQKLNTMVFEMKETKGLKEVGPSIEGRRWSQEDEI